MDFGGHGLGALRMLCFCYSFFCGKRDANIGHIISLEVIYLNTSNSKHFQLPLIAITFI